MNIHIWSASWAAKGYPQEHIILTVRDESAKGLYRSWGAHIQGLGWFSIEGKITS